MYKIDYDSRNPSRINDNFLRLILLTPSEKNVHSDARVGISEECQKDQIMQIYTLHQDPGIVGQEKVLPQTSEYLAVPVAFLLVDQPVTFVILDHGIRQSDARHEEQVLE